MNNRKMNERKLDLLVATRNPGKIIELNSLLANLPLSLLSLSDVGIETDVEETGSTFAENALLKAKSYALESGMTAVADDSGLEVDALKGAPGIYSARYAGKGAPNENRIEKLLLELKNSGTNDRSARFVCVMAVANSAGEILHTATGICPGSIAFEPRGMNGFGYDPVFVPDDHNKTFGELSDEVKSKISHRARASASIVRFLRDFIAV